MERYLLFQILLVNLLVTTNIALADDSLYVAIKEGNSEQVRTILSEGYNVNQGYKGTTLAPLMYALLQKQPEIAQYLILNGANVNASYRGMSPLSIAILQEGRKYKEIIKLMIKKGANVNLPQADGGTPFTYAVGTGRYLEDEIIELFMNGSVTVKVNVADQQGRTPLICSIAYDYQELLKMLIDLGAKINIVDKKGRTPLMHATYYSQPAIVELLLKNGANINFQTTSNGMSALMGALLLYEQDPISSEYDKIATILLNNGANVNQKDKAGNTTLMYAIRAGSKDLYKKIIEKGANLNATNSVGIGALQFASASGRKEIVEYLIAKGARINHKSDDGETALSAALEHDHIDIAELLRENGASE